jgi:hypothetical protein
MTSAPLELAKERCVRIVQNLRPDDLFSLVEVEGLRHSQ